MKNNKVLAVALSAGLVFSGAYLANSNINVAYASESQPTIEELKAQITQLKNEKNEIDRKKLNLKMLLIGEKIIERYPNYLRKN